jgi:hypothetical protein
MVPWRPSMPMVLGMMRGDGKGIYYKADGREDTIHDLACELSEKSR